MEDKKIHKLIEIETSLKSDQSVALLKQLLVLPEKIQVDERLWDKKACETGEKVSVGNTFLSAQT